jgi:signal transduction histidine kinase
MDTSSPHLRRKEKLRLWGFLLLILAAILFAILAVGRAPSRETHDAILTSLRAIDINHASLQRDVLQARAGLLQNYDPLVASVVNLHGAVTKLRSLFSQSDVASDSSLERPLDILSQSIDADEAMVEEFKTRNALLQNSLAIFNEVLSELHESQFEEMQRALSSSNDLGNLMMRFAAQPDDGLAQRIRYQLDALLQSNASVVSDLRTLVTHGRMVLVTLPTVDNIIWSVQASKTSANAEALQQKYLDAFGRLSSRSAWTRTFLGSVSVMLCGYIGFLVYRLRCQREMLAQRLDFEAVLRVLKERFERESEDFSTAMTASLAALADFFEAEKYRFATVSIETGQSEIEFGFPQTPLFEEVVRDFAAQKGSGQGHPFFHRNLHRHGVDGFGSNVMSDGAAVALATDDRTAAILLLEYAEIRVKPNADEILLLRGAIEALVQCIETHRSEQEKEQLETQLEHSQRLEAVGTLAGGIAHEFNNVLAAMLGYGEMALQTTSVPSQTRRYLEEIVSSGERAKHIIDQILTFSRKRERVSRPFDMSEAVADIIPLLKISLSRGLELEASLSDGPVPIVGNPIEIQQIVMNLCSNAAQASQEGGLIHISLTAVETRQKKPLSHAELPPGNYAYLSVTDNGSGIAESVLPHIFEPFFTTKENTGGTGLGLAAVHGNVTGMMGSLDVESRLGEGTRFGLYFPLSRQTPISLKQFFDERLVPLGSGQTVLILEQETTLRLMYEEKIAAVGYEPVGFADMDSLLAWLRGEGNTPDLVILDAATVEMSQQTRLDPLLGKIPILLIADQVTDTWLGGRSLRTIGALRKPVSSMNLISAVFSKIDKAELPSCSPLQADTLHPSIDSKENSSSDYICNPLGEFENKPRE